MKPDQTNGSLNLAVLRAELQAEYDRLDNWQTAFRRLSDRVAHRLQGLQAQLKALEQLDTWTARALEYPVPELPELPEVGQTEHVDSERYLF